MSSDFVPPTEMVKGPRLSEHEMQQKLEEMRKGVAKKMGAWADRVQVSMAYTPNIERLEGERWTENGKPYVMRNGIKESISIMQESRMPWWCPRCTKSMSHRFDRKFYYIRGWCFNCNVEVEGQMRLDGTYEAFERRTMRENEKAFLRDKIQQHLDYIRTFKVPQIHFEDGRWEELATLDQFQGLFAELEKDVELCQARLDAIQVEEQKESESYASTTQESPISG